MQMLAAGGMECHGCFPDFEIPQSQHLSSWDGWRVRLLGRAIKILDPHKIMNRVTNERICPRIQDADVIICERDAHQQAESMEHFLRARGVGPRKLSKADRVKSFEQRIEKELDYIEDLVGEWPNVRLCKLQFETAIEKPIHTARVLSNFLEDAELDVERMSVVVADRKPECSFGRVEAELLESVSGAS